jgi:hypothetical protein
MVGIFGGYETKETKNPAVFPSGRKDKRRESEITMKKLMID